MNYENCFFDHVLKGVCVKRTRILFGIWLCEFVYFPQCYWYRYLPNKFEKLDLLGGGQVSRDPLGLGVAQRIQNSQLGGGNSKNFGIFTPKIGEDSHFDDPQEN